MSDTSKMRAKLAKLDTSLDELESQLEPLFAQSLPETLLALDTIQQAKLQVIIPYVVYDLVFVYLKSRGIDPKTHPVVAELERVRQYFDKITHAEESVEQRKHGIDKAAAGRFIKHAIAQAKNAQLANDVPDATVVVSSSSNHEHVPVKVTSKMMARAEYQEKLEQLGSEEEDDLRVFDPEVEDEEDVDEDAGPPRLDKGKGRAPEEHSSRPKRPRVDPFAGYEDPTTSTPQISDHAKISTSGRSTPANDSDRGLSVTVEDRKARKAAKKAKRKAKKA